MVILSGSNIGSTQSHSLPSPARGSPPGISPNKNLTSVTPALTGLERMLQGWRRQAEKKAQQFRQRDLDAESKRQKEQQEVNEMRVRIIESRMKKIEQQQHSSTKNARNNSISADNVEPTRKRRSDDDYYLSTPSDGGFSCDSPDAFGIETGFCPAKTAKMSADKPSPVEKNASVFIETFQLPPAPPTVQPPAKRPAVGRSTAQIPAYPTGGNLSAVSPHAIGFNPNATTTSIHPSLPMACAQGQRLHDQQFSANASMASFRGQMGEVALPRDIEEEMIRSLPVDLDAALTPDLLRAIDDLEWNPTATSRAPTSHVKPTTAPPTSTNANSNSHYSVARMAQQPPTYSVQQQYSLTQQQLQQPQQHYMMNRGSALGAWHHQQAYLAPPPPYSSASANPYAISRQDMLPLQQQAPHGWSQNMMGNPAAGFGQQY